MSIGSPRRYYLLKAFAARDKGDDALERSWRGKQERESGTALPSDFPSLEALVAAGYSTREDIDGAERSELQEETELTERELDAVIAARDLL